jgi:hypothetical protein
LLENGLIRHSVWINIETTSKDLLCAEIDLQRVATGYIHILVAGRHVEVATIPAPGNGDSSKDNVMYSPEKPSTPAEMNPLAQLRLAYAKPWAALLGATPGIVPVGVFWLGHYEITSWDPRDCPKVVIVYAGLIFSVLTVFGWSSDMFGSKTKAAAFTILLEGIMMMAGSGILAAVALGYLVAINAVANGCRLVRRDHDVVRSSWCENLSRCIVVAATATLVASQRLSRQRKRRVAKRSKAPLLSAVSA